MKLAAQQLEQHLKTQLAPLYILSGDEVLLRQDAIDLIRETARQRGFQERIRIPVESGTDWGKLFFENAQSLSLFSTKRLLELDLSTAKFNQTTSGLLKEYAEQPAADTVLIIQTSKIDSKTLQTKWFQALEKQAVVIQLWPIPSQQLPQWILQRAKHIQLTLSKKAADCIASQVEGNLLAAVQELEKLRLLQTTQALDDQTIEAALSDNASFDIFDLVDSALAGHSSRVLRILKNLSESDVEPTLILWAITRELRTLIDIALQLKTGVPLSRLFTQYRIFEKRQPTVQAFLKSVPVAHCKKILASAAQIDRMIKGAEPGNVWDALEACALSLAGSDILSMCHP